jgi:hypothetical protein
MSDTYEVVVTAYRGSRDYDPQRTIYQVPASMCDLFADAINKAVEDAVHIAQVHGPFSGGVSAHVREL